MRKILPFITPLPRTAPMKGMDIPLDMLHPPHGRLIIIILILP